MIMTVVLWLPYLHRDGPYGAVFHPRVAGRPPVVYSARQGGRMWEVRRRQRVAVSGKRKYANIDNRSTNRITDRPIE